jgi:starch phosphorylase
VNSNGELLDGVATQMHPAVRDAGGCWIYEAAKVACSRSGLHGFTVRVLPYHQDLTVPFLPGLIAWAEP